MPAAGLTNRSGHQHVATSTEVEMTITATVRTFCFLVVLTLGRVATGASQPTSERDRPDSASYYEWQVTVAARPLAAIAPPGYPPGLRRDRVRGVVLAQWIVDTTGT